MRKLSVLVFAVVIGLAGFGCDSSSSDDGPSDSERLAGNWALTGVTDNDGDQMATFAAGFNSVVVTLNQNGTYSIAIDSKLPEGDTTISGTYTIDDSMSRLTLGTEVAGQPINLIFTYAFVGDTQATFTATSQTATFLNVLLGTTLQGTVRLTITKV